MCYASGCTSVHFTIQPSVRTLLKEETTCHAQSRPVILIVSVIVGLVLLTGCAAPSRAGLRRQPSRPPRPRPNPPRPPPDPMADLIKAAQAEGTLTTIALPHDWCNYGEAIEGFKAKYGLAVNELNPDAGSGDEIEAVKANKDNKGPQAPDVIDVGLGFGPQISRGEARPAVQGRHLGHHPGRRQGPRWQLVRRLLRRALPSSRLTKYFLWRAHPAAIDVVLNEDEWVVGLVLSVDEVEALSRGIPRPLVSMRFLVNGPVSSIRPSAWLWITPRGTEILAKVWESPFSDG